MATDISSPKLADYQASWQNRQPDNMDGLRPTGFRFLLQTLPKVTYFVQSANIPDIRLGVAIQPTPYVDLAHPGEKLDFGELAIQFFIQEDMGNYLELYNWMIGLGFPDNRQEFASYVDAHGNKGGGQNEIGQLSDASLLILGSNNMPVTLISFLSCFPTSLSGLEFDVSQGRTDYFTARATFRYQKFTVETVGKPS